ncbi:MBOAT family O-acyltransferase [Acidaminobacter hydrogenoformans]|uniref:Alginate O-acetyltransferase complex protein AlgI n=1 Tax=Acidaminobacter hydrogenoformans DSM 2784 TaxID=1120920 RepID=A0A1G5S484_9FIRM|nr:MBOAT family O-acyltransferase [Acidaminobacter hydrogenoformans]SCZ81133.1 alginate O-acetyltransferase complex protein AlgI [Acidaminobacter hydrogenoformans DSM 2784]
MLFSSIVFLYYFLPCVLLLYFISPKRMKNLVLLSASLFFYWWGEPKYVLLMIFTILLGYGHGILIDKFRGDKASKVFLISSVSTSIMLLGFFKYADFFIKNTNALFSSSLSLLNLALPIGISFYTFQTLSYTIDVYRGDAKVIKNPINLATYVALFPQLIAGPIVRYTTIEEALNHRTHSLDDFAYGAFRFVVGLAKKVLIANALGELCEIFLDSGEKSVLFFWVYAIAFSLHIYFDFSGYSDMAIGLGRIFGFHYLENFNYPYVSKSVTEFWRRWHMSLSTWFRDYIYIPMGGNRVKVSRWLFNIIVVWMLTGFWHGAEWNFIVWGLFFALFLIIEKLWIGKYLEKAPSVLSRFYVLLLVAVSFVIFNADGMKEAITYISAMFGTQGYPLITAETLYYLRSYAVIIGIAVIGSTPFIKNSVQLLQQYHAARRILNTVEPVVMVALLLVITAYLVDGSFNPFLYFRF